MPIEGESGGRAGGQKETESLESALIAPSAKEVFDAIIDLLTVEIR